MSESLRELLGRSADATPELRLDIDELVAVADRRQRRRRLAVAAAAAGVVGAIVLGSFLVRNDPSGNLEPAPTPPPSPPSSVAVDPSGTRPLVYAEGSTVHVGDEWFDAGGVVGFLDLTDDGVAFVTEDERMWFHHGTTTQAIGRADRWPGDFFYMSGQVMTANPGSLLVWEDATSRTHGQIDQFVVYDTSRREVVSTIPYVGRFSQLLHVDDDHVFFSPDTSMPGCWVSDINDLHPCKDPQLFRYDVASDETTKITLAALDAELRTHVRMFVAAAPGTDLGFLEGARFRQVGRQLVHTDPDGETSVLTRTSGEAVQLRLPSGYTAPGGTEGSIGVSQWLDDDHIVLWANDGNGDLQPKRGDLLVCRLPDGVCRVAVRESSDLYVAPGPA